MQAELAGLNEKGREKQVRDEYKGELDAYADHLGIAKSAIGTVKIWYTPRGRRLQVVPAHALPGYPHGAAGLE